MAEVSPAKREKSQIEWRRNKVQELVVKGYNQYEIADTLKISQPTISRDLRFPKTTGTRKSQDTYSEQTARRISKLYGWNKSSIKDLLGDCKQIQERE